MVAEEESSPPFPDDPYFRSTGSWGQSYRDQYWLHLIEAPYAWQHANGSGITVAYTDFIKGDHPDLVGQLWINENEIPDNGADDDSNGYIDDYYGPCLNTWCVDFQGHGTPMAGLIAARTNNAQGIASLSYGSKLLAVDFAFEYAIDNGAKVIVHSYATRSAYYEDVLEYAYDNGVMSFVAAGNQNAYSMTLGTLPTTINVGSVDWTDNRYWSSGWGDALDVVAPGAGLLTTGYNAGSLGNGYTVGTGTSFAAPIAASLASLLLSYDPSLTPGQIRYIILNSVDDGGVTGWDPYYGHGRINVRKALDAVRAGGNVPDWSYESRITSPRWMSAVGESDIVIEGTATSPNFQGYTIEVCDTGLMAHLFPPYFHRLNFAPFNCREIISSVTPVSNGVLGSFHPDDLGLGLHYYYLLRLRVTDGNIPHYKPYLTTFNINDPPVLSPIGDRAFSIGGTLTIQLSAQDPNGDILYYSYNITPPPRGGFPEFDGQTRTFRWTPTDLDVGAYQVDFEVIDLFDGYDAETIRIYVGNRKAGKQQMTP